MSSVKKAAKSAIIIVILGLLSKPLGFLREMLMGSKFGSGMQTDTYLLALSAISLFAGLLNKTINTTLIPILSEVEKKEGEEGKLLHTNNFLNLIILTAIALTIIGTVFSSSIVKVIAPGFDTENQFNLAVLLIRIGMPSLIFNSIQGVLIGYLQTEGRFKEGAAIGIPMNFAFIFFLLFLSSNFGIVGLMVTSTLASILQVLFVIIGVRKTNYRYKFYVNVHDEYIKKILVLIPPILISVGISDLNAIVDKSMGSTLVNGSISALNYAEKLGAMVRGIFISAITTVMYPEFAKAAHKEDKTELKESIILSINLTLLITVPATIGMMVLAKPIVILAFERGAFDHVATMMTTSALVYTAMRMTSSSIQLLLHNVFYSLQDTKVPLYVGIFAVITNIASNALLIGPMKHDGLALGTTISSFLSTILLIYLLRKRLGSVGFMDSVKVGLKTLFASIVMGLVVVVLYRYLLLLLGAQKIMQAISLVVSVTVGIVLYVGIVYLLKVKELHWFMSALKGRMR